MKVLKYHRSAFERQISESVLIQSNGAHKLLNLKAEFNRCALPRLTIKLGEKPIKEREDDISEEIKADEVLVAKIRDLRRKRNLERKTVRGLPARKRLKMEDNVHTTPPKPKLTPQEKRQLENNMINDVTQRPAKRARRQEDIRKSTRKDDQTSV